MLEPKPLTVRQVLDRLRTMPMDAECHTEGCDCEGPCVAVYKETDGRVILARRAPPEKPVRRQRGERRTRWSEE